jgi:GTPase SAR1 family protein
MIGQDYLNLRARLGTALSSLQTLAGELRAPPESVATLQELQKSLHEPLLFVVVGDAKAGKSTLLNALFGREFLPPHAPSGSERIHLIKYGEERDVAIGDDLIECHRNADFLRDFNIVDTPGVNFLMARHQTITGQFIPRADLVLFVFSAVTPWSATAWSFLQLIDRRWLKRVALVLQQSELRSDDELASIASYLRKTLRERFGRQCPVFAVSAQCALAATLSGENVSEVLAATGMERLEQFINAEVAMSEARLETLRQVCQQAVKILAKLCPRVAPPTTPARRKAKAIQIEHELADSKEQALRQIGGVLWSMAQSHEEAQKRGEELFLERLTLPNAVRLLFRSGDWRRDLHGQIEECLRYAIQTQIEDAVQLLDTDLRQVWTDFEEALCQSFPDGPVPLRLPEFQPQQAYLLDRIEQTLLDCARHQQLNDQIEKRFAETARWLRLPAVLILLSGLAMALVANLRPSHLQITVAAAGGAVLASICLAFLKRRRVLAELRQQMFRKGEATLSGIENHLRCAVENFIATLTPVLVPLHNVRPAPVETTTPLSQRLDQLNEVFAKNAAELGLAPDRPAAKA